ncbi:MAG: hypothetical protein NT004_13220, partial [Bacteroidetes bacterium]|nr:hypothetical protein [Bacteroidota bacterium]
MKINDRKGSWIPIPYFFFVVLFSLGFYTGANGQTPTSSCANSNFSLGDFTNWTGCCGDWNNQFPPPCNNPNQPWINSPNGGHYQIIPAPGAPDNFVTVINSVFPGEAYSALIGKHQVNNGGGSIDQLTYPMVIGSDNQFFIYRCAVVLGGIYDATHNTADKRPRFTIEIKDHVTGVLLDPLCGFFDVYPGDGQPGWDSLGEGTSKLIFKNWNTVGIDLSQMTVLGQTIDVVFTVHGCSYSAHTGYAYISTTCGSMNIDLAGCEGSGFVTLSGPPGFAEYKWQGPFCPDPILCPTPAPIFYGQSVTINTAQGAVSGNLFDLTLTASNGCFVKHVQQLVAFTSVDANFSSVINCVGNSSSFTDISTSTNQSQPIVKRRWRFDTDSAFTAVTTNATITHTYNVIGPHVVTIESLSQDSCMGTITDTVNVGPPPMFINLPPGPEKPICSGDKAAITLAFTQTGADATWTYQITSGTPVIHKNPVNQSGLTINDTIVNIGPGDAVVTYTITPRIGDCTGVDTTFQVTVHPLPVPLISGFATVCAGANDVSYSTETGKSNYAWVVSSGGIITSGQGSDSILVTWNAAGMQTVSANYTDANGCDAMAPTVINVTVNPVPTANSVGNQVLCHNAQTSVVSFSGSVPGTVYNWANSNTSIGLGAGGSGAVPSFTATNTSFVPVTAIITVTPVYTNAGVTCTGTSTSFNITVNPIPTITPVTNQVLCHNTQTNLITFAGSVQGTVFNWTNSQPSIGIAAGGSGDISVFTATNTSTNPVTATITVTPQFTNAGTTCGGTPTFFTITVNPIPVVNPITSQVLCHNSPTSQVSISGNVPGTVYNWVNSNASIGLAASGSGTIPSFTATNTSFVPVTATITVTPVFNNAGPTCTGTPVAITITVNPIPTINPVNNQVLCHNTQTTLVSFIGDVQGTVFNWTNSQPSIGIAASGTGDISAFTVTNTTTTPITATITVTPQF